ERKVGTQTDEHPPPLAVIDIEIVLSDPAIGDLEMPSVRLAVTDCNENACRFARFENDHHRIRPGPLEIGSDEVIAAAIRRLENRDVPFLRPILEPRLKLLGNAAQDLPANWIDLPVGIEEPDHPLWLLKRLDQPVQQDPVKATVVPADAVLVVFVEGVHERPPRLVRHQDDSSSLCSISGIIPSSRPAFRQSAARKRCPGCRARHRQSRREASWTARARRYIENKRRQPLATSAIRGYQGRSPWLVSAWSQYCAAFAPATQDVVSIQCIGSHASRA